MQKISIAVAALIGVNAVKFIDQYESKFDSFAQTTAGSAAAAGSGVRAQWIELPNCQSFVVDGPTMTYDAEHGEVIPLKEDLSNAIIATCKGPSVAHNPTPATPNPITTNIPVEQSQIFDPVWKTDTVIPDQEHQVGPLQHGVIDKSAETAGPTGDFASAWKYTNGAAQPYQAAPAAWDNEGAGAVNSTSASTSPTNYGPNPTPAVLLQFIEVPEEEVTLQIAVSNKWVELPVCAGAAGEKPLNLHHENAIHATCKNADPMTAPDAKEVAEKAAIAAAAAAEAADAEAAVNSQATAAAAPVVVDPNAAPSDAATITANSKSD